MDNISVVQPWVSTLPLKMQSTLLLSLRGPDTHSCVEVKKITRWMRGLVFVPGDPRTVRQFMLAELPPRILEKTVIARELEFASQHFYSHLMHGLEVLAYCHPDPKVFTHAHLLFSDMCILFHLTKESKAEFKSRLAQLEWPGGKQPRTGEEGVAIVDRYDANIAELVAKKVHNDK